jgi:hypothetical protein
MITFVVLINNHKFSYKFKTIFIDQIIHHRNLLHQNYKLSLVRLLNPQLFNDANHLQFLPNCL